VARSPDPATLLTSGLLFLEKQETFGQKSGGVRRPRHNRCLCKWGAIDDFEGSAYRFKPTGQYKFFSSDGRRFE
jgi:hypothetical protein